MRKYARVAMALGVGCALFANGNSASTGASAGVRIVAPVKITAVQHLNFGSIVVGDVAKTSTITMAFNGIAPGIIGNLTGNLASTRLTAMSNCTPYRKSAAHTPALFHLQKDAWVASFNIGGAGLLDTDVTIVIDRAVTLSGGTGGPVNLQVATDIPADPFIPAGALAGATYRRFQLAGKLDIPAGCLGSKTGTINVSVSYN
ncbi:MAG: hypothetical protein Q8O00_01890 [Holophaga sp.]|nr:hypothetical protein [Holophaga sp.]